MKARIANKIYNAVAAYKAFETNRQPYTPNQQRKALKALRLPLHVRHMIRVCHKVKDPKSVRLPFEYIGNAATGEIQPVGSKLAMRRIWEI